MLDRAGLTDGRCLTQQTLVPNKNLYLTVTPVADMYAGQRGPLPGALLLKNATLTYRILSR